MSFFGDEGCILTESGADRRPKVIISSRETFGSQRSSRRIDTVLCQTDSTGSEVCSLAPYACGDGPTSTSTWCEWDRLRHQSECGGQIIPGFSICSNCDRGHGWFVSYGGCHDGVVVGPGPLCGLQNPINEDRVLGGNIANNEEIL